MDEIRDGDPLPVEVEKYMGVNKKDMFGRPPNYILKYDQLDNLRRNISNEISERRASPLYASMSIVDGDVVSAGQIVSSVSPKNIGGVIKSLSTAINNIELRSPFKIDHPVVHVGDYPATGPDDHDNSFPTDDSNADSRPEHEKNPIEARDMGEMDADGADKSDSTSLIGRVRSIVRSCICHSDCAEFWWETVNETVWYDCGCYY